MDGAVMTRSDRTIVAINIRAVYETANDDEQHGVRDVALALASALTDNERDRSQFLADCGVQS
jgi:hypothetical protein